MQHNDGDNNRVVDSMDDFCEFCCSKQCLATRHTLCTLGNTFYAMRHYHLRLCNVTVETNVNLHCDVVLGTVARWVLEGRVGAIPRHVELKKMFALQDYLVEMSHRERWNSDLGAGVCSFHAV